MASCDSYLYGVKVNKNIFKLFQEEKTRCHALSSRDGICDEIKQHTIILNYPQLLLLRSPVDRAVRVQAMAGDIACCVLGQDSLLS